MKIYLYYISKARDPYCSALTAEYVARTAHFAQIQSLEIRPDRSDLFAKHASAKKIFLDPLGRSFDSHQFAHLLSQHEMSGQDLVFLVGGADGLPPEWRSRADTLLSLSAMTFPHELARTMLAEQIYRGFAILRNHPYPR